MARYEENKILNLSVDFESRKYRIKVQIRKLITPFTLSVAMVVDILEANYSVSLPERAFLKLYDRRFSDNLREQWDAPKWTIELERDLHDAALTGKANSFLDRARDKDTEFDESCSDAEKEVHLWDILNDDFKNEMRAYKELQKHQGTLIPMFYSSVVFHTASNESLGDWTGLVQIPGILIEFLDGFNASEIDQHTPRCDWNYLVNRAANIVGDVLHRSKVINGDVRPENMIVCQDERNDRGYRLVMIDFGQCRFRTNETDAEWGLEKHRQDEEGAMGVVMRIKLKKNAGFEAEFNYPWTWREFAEREVVKIDRK